MITPVQQCGPTAYGNYRLAITETGGLLRSEDESDWQGYDFNAQYEGYLPPCRFTALACDDDLVYLAGMALKDNRPCLFTSISGGVWTRRSLIMYHLLDGMKPLNSEICRILCYKRMRQVFLICRNGELATLSDCPKCLRIQTVTDMEVADAALNDYNITLSLVCGGSVCVPLDDALQFRISPDFAEKKRASGAILIDMRDSIEHAAGGLPHSVNVPYESVIDWLYKQPKNGIYIFICRTGINADNAARLARAAGYANAFSLGGSLLLALAP